MGWDPITNACKVLNYSYTNKIKNAIIKANKAIASVNANPKIANLNKSSLMFGFLAVAKIKDPKINPIPTPAPASPKVDKPAPSFCAACNNIIMGFYIFNSISQLKQKKGESNPQFWIWRPTFYH